MYIFHCDAQSMLFLTLYANTFSLCIASYILDDLHCDIGGSFVTDVETM